MQIDLEEMIREGGNLEALIPEAALGLEPDAPRIVGLARLEGKLQRVRQGFEFNAGIQGRVRLECVRCLEPFDLDLHSDFHLTFVTTERASAGGERQIQEADCDIYPCGGTKVDLAAVAREQIYLQIPLKPVCSTACRGLCAACGENLDRGLCRCGEPAQVRVI